MRTNDGRKFAPKGVLARVFECGLDAVQFRRTNKMQHFLDVPDPKIHK
jgi:hypothetical protein